MSPRKQTEIPLPTGQDGERQPVPEPRRLDETRPIKKRVSQFLGGKAQVTVLCRAGQLGLGGLLQINLAQSLGVAGLNFSAPLMSVAQNITNVIPLNWDAELVRRNYVSNRQMLGTLLVVSTFRVMASLAIGCVGLLLLTGATGRGYDTAIYLGLFGFIAAAAWNPGWYLQKNGRVDCIVYAQGVTSVAASLLFLTCRYTHWIRPGLDIYLMGFGALAGGVFLFLRGIDPEFRRVRIAFKEARQLLMEVAWKSRRLTAYSSIRFIYLWSDFLLLSWFGPSGAGGEYRVTTLVPAFLTSLFNLIPLFLYPAYVKLCSEGLVNEATVRLQIDSKRFGRLAFAAVPVITCLNLAGLWVVGTPSIGLLICGVLFTYARVVGILSTLGTSLLWAKGDDKSPLQAVAAGAGLSLTLNLFMIPRYGVMAAAGSAIMSEFLVWGICSAKTTWRKSVG